MFKNNRNLLIIALIAIVNALGYGIIIPILYSYSMKFGLSDFQNGLLFALFSLCQFFSTPIIGRLSDKYGRRPLLIASISGTALSFFMMAFAPSAIFLFIARALDGITAGNIPVASAVISDTTAPKDRAKGFGIIGASFGFGFIFGPAISAVTVNINPALPFIIAGVISIIAAGMTALFLPETNKHMGEVSHDKLFNFNKLIHALTNKTVGATLLLTLCFFTALSMYIYSFNASAVKLLHMNENQISMMFVLFGVVGLFSQLVLLNKTKEKFGVKKTFLGALIWITGTYLAMFFSRSIFLFMLANVALGLINSFIQPLSQTILSEEVSEKEQGEMQGINASYMSIGQIIGPILAGGLVTLFTKTNIETVVHNAPAIPFLGSSVMVMICFFLGREIFSHLPQSKKIV